LTRTDVTSNHQLHVSLLAPDRTDVPAAPLGVLFGGVWQTDAETLGVESINLAARYDQQWLRTIAVDESRLQLLAFDNGGWSAVPNFSVSAGGHILLGDAPPASFYAYGVQPLAGAVQTPEPSMLGLLALTGCALLARRRRRG